MQLEMNLISFERDNENILVTNHNFVSFLS